MSVKKDIIFKEYLSACVCVRVGEESALEKLFSLFDIYSRK